MIPKSGNRFSEKIMHKRANAGLRKAGLTRSHRSIIDYPEGYGRRTFAGRVGRDKRRVSDAHCAALRERAELGRMAQCASLLLGWMAGKMMSALRGTLAATVRASLLTLGLTGGAMAQEQILISSSWGNVKAELVDNEATRSLVRMLPVTIEMRDHLRQEKTGDLPSPLAPVPRQTAFSKGTLGLWSSDHFVIYYRDGRVPQPGIILLGRVTGDVSIFDRPGSVTVRVELAPK